ncbi:MAG: ribonuclease III family protein [Candidatus Thorarchaeota archaeon]
MQELKKTLRIQDEKTGRNLQTYIHQKSNAKLGDSLVNFIYSVAKSLVSGIPTGMKVSDSILAEAFKSSSWHTTKTLKLSGKKDRIADAVEALILFFWIQEGIFLEKLIGALESQLEPHRLRHPKEEHNSAVLAFQNLLNFLFQIYSEKASNKDEEISSTL